MQKAPLNTPSAAYQINPSTFRRPSAVSTPSALFLSPSRGFPPTMSSLQDSSLIMFKAPKSSGLRSPCTPSTLSSIQAITAMADLTHHIVISCPPNIWMMPNYDDFCCRQEIEQPVSHANPYMSSMSIDSFQSTSTIFEDTQTYGSSMADDCDDFFNEDPDSTMELPSNNPRFFVIKSYSALDVLASFKHDIWSSTDFGNKRLANAFRENAGNIYLFFSVNASAKFCGVSKMTGNVDFTRASDIWADASRWKGVFPVEWLAKKDIPNRRFRHLIITSNENKPVSASRDTQEIPYEIGVEMLQIFGLHPTMFPT